MSKRKNKVTPVASAQKHNYSGSLSLVIPCYNEQKRIGNLLKQLKSFDQKWQNPLEIIIIDDGSSDQSVDKIKKDFVEAFGSKTSFQLIELPKNQGKGGALKAGVAAATGDYILTVDADMATKPNALFKWLKELPGKTFPENEILIGSREHEKSAVKGQLLRRFAGLIFNFIIQLFTNLHLSDTQCGFKLYPRENAKRLFADLGTNGWAHDVELLYAARLQNTPIRTMPVAWEHQEDSKISLFSDSLKMFGQTIMISTRLNWRHFIQQPLRDLTARTSGGGKEPSWYRLLFVVLSLALLIGMPMMSFDYGITGDEELQKTYGELILKHFETDGEYVNKDDENALNYKNLYYYGGLFDYVAAWMNEHVGGLDPYDMRHLLNSLVGFLMIFFTGLLARELTGSWRMAFFAILFMALSPRIFGHSMNNPKDIPFAAAYAFTLLYLIRFIKQLPRPGSKTVVMLTIGIAAAINVRVGGILLIAYFGLFVGIAYLLQPELRKLLSSPGKVGRIVLIGVLVAVLGYFGGMLCWPYAQQAPLTNPFKALSEMSNFSTSIRMLFEGEHLWSDELPWYYIPKWVAISAPLFALLGLLFFVGFFIIRFKKEDLLPLAFVAFTAIFPVAYAIYKESSLYDGMRHFLFIFPVLIVLAVWGWDQLIRLPKMRWPASGVLVLLMVLPAFWMIKNYPYHYIYFNELSGGVNRAYAYYETDYWMNSIKEMSDWMIENVPAIKGGDTIMVQSNCYVPAAHYLTKRYKNARVRYARYNDRHRNEGDYFMFISRFVNKDLMKNEAWPPGEVIYEAKVGDITIGAITKRAPELYDYRAAEAEKKRDFAAAASFYEQASQQHPNNETAWFGLANAHLQQRNFPQAKTAIDEFIKLSDTHVNGQFALALYHYNLNQVEEAKKVLQRLTRLNYKYNASYYYLALIYARENNTAKLAETLEMYDSTGGRSPQIYDMGIQVFAQTGDRGKELYFKAKKLYFQQQYQEAYNTIQQATTVAPDYEVAQKFRTQFEEQLGVKQK